MEECPNALSYEIVSCNVCFCKEVVTDFGNTFLYHNDYFGRSNDQCITIEQMIDREFEKTINNDGMVFCGNEVMRKKAESFVNYAWE